ncbi:MAG: tetratricopeptide repeat protein, partial [Deltaproteobacteria bacterium]|nr:tetratricopeptide repeat protein [Deltaproteobacteria bacterium]
ITMTNIGAHLVRFGRYAEARTELQRAREIFEHSVGVDHPLTAHALNAMAGCAVREFGFERGRALFEQVVDIRERALHPRHLQVADALANLGGVLTDLDRNDEARTVLRRALSILEEHRGTEHPDLGGALLNLADAERHSGNIERAERLVGRATALWEEHFGPDHPELIYALRVTGEIHMERGRTQAAIEVVERARALDSKARQDPAFRAELDFLLARALWNADRDPIRARILAQDAMEVLQGFESFPASRREPIGRWLAEREAEQGDEHPGRRPRVADARALPTAGGTDRASAGPGPRRPGPR